MKDLKNRCKTAKKIKKACATIMFLFELAGWGACLACIWLRPAGAWSAMGASLCQRLKLAVYINLLIHE